MIKIQKNIFMTKNNFMIKEENNKIILTIDFLHFESLIYKLTHDYIDYCKEYKINFETLARMAETMYLN